MRNESIRGDTSRINLKRDKTMTERFIPNVSKEAMRLQNHILDHQEQVLFTTPEIEEIIGKPISNGGYGILSGVRSRLLNQHGIFLGCDRGVGYRIMNDTEKADHASNRDVRAMRQTNRAIKEAKAVNEVMLTPERKELFDREEARRKLLASFSGKRGLDKIESN